MLSKERHQTATGPCVSQDAPSNQLYEVALQYMPISSQIWHQPAVALKHRVFTNTIPCGCNLNHWLLRLTEEEDTSFS